MVWVQRQLCVFVLAAIGFAHAPTHVIAQTQPQAETGPLELDSAFSSTVVGQRVSVLVDERGTLQPDDVRTMDPKRFTPHTDPVPSYGFSDSVYWFRLEVINPQAQSVDWLLELGYPHLDYIHVYGPSRTESFKHSFSGDRLPFSQRDVDYRDIVFELTTPPGAHVYFVRVNSSGPVTVPITAWSMRAFFDHVNAQSPPLWMFYGLMLVMVVYNLFIYFAVRQLPYLYYVLYIAAFMLFQFTLNGLAFQYLWPNSPDWANRFTPTAIGLAFAMGVQFMRHFVELKRNLPRYDRICAWLGLGGGVIAVALAQTTPVRISIRFAIVACIFVILSALPAVIWLSIRGQRQARYYLAAWMVFFGGILLYLFKSVGLIPTNAVTEWTIQFGAALEVVLLSLGLADRINAMRRDLAGLNQQLESNVVRLTTALDQAEEAQRAKSAFLASVSHELRTPLNAIINIPEGLLEHYHQVDVVRCETCATTFDADPDEVVDTQTPCPECANATLAIEKRWVFDGDAGSAADHLRLVHRAGTHLLDVVSDILDISKLEAGKMSIHTRPTDLTSLLRDVTAPMVALAQAKGVTLDLRVPDDERMISADATKLRQVVLNLVGNAIKFSDGRGAVRVELRDEAEHVCVGVHDQGVGISDKDKPQIFGRFVQAQSNDTRKFGGTGLGLAISKQLVELHGGELWFESEQGRGSDFYVRLPRLAASQHEGVRAA